jgi:hypothetical protein
MSTNKLTVLAGDEVAEITVFEGDQHTVARGLVKIEQELPPGLYKVRVRVGPTVSEKLISLDENREVLFPSLDIPTPIPLERTKRRNDAHTAAAIEASRTPLDTFGAGASILIFSREPPRSQTARVVPQQENPATGLSLLTEAGDVLADIEQRAAVQGDGDPCAGWRGNVEPGAYRLRLKRKDGTAVERAIYASRGMQVQVFLQVTDYMLTDGTQQRLCDMSGSAIAISPQQEFQPLNPRTRLAELAGYALTQSRRILSDGFLGELLDEKFDHPMLGLFGAHLLLRDKPDDRRQFVFVMNNLLRLLGRDHPDVRALWRRRPDSDARVPLELYYPPMLRLSWDVALENDDGHSDALAEGPNAIADRILPGAPWLMWRIDPAGRPSSAELALKDYLGSRVRAEKERFDASRTVFNKVTSAVRRFVTRSTAPTPAPPPLDAREKADLIRTLGVPDKMLKSMLDKLSH